MGMLQPDIYTIDLDVLVRLVLKNAYFLKLSRYLENEI